MKDIAKRFELALASIVLGTVLVCSYSALTSTTARAQTTGPTVTTFKSFGPLQVNISEDIHIGLLLPAVRTPDLNAHLQLFDSAGRMLSDTPVAMGDGSVRGVSFRLFRLDGSLKLLDEFGNTLMTVQNNDGIVTGLLLPAVRPGGQTVSPLAASVETVNAEGVRGQFAAFSEGMLSPNSSFP